MKTLDEHNEEQWARRPQINAPVKANVACPNCGKEMLYTNSDITLLSHPPKKDVHCECGYRGYKVQ